MPSVGGKEEEKSSEHLTFTQHKLRSKVNSFPASIVRGSLVHGPDPPEKEGPGIHCLRMCLISQNSWENRGLLCYIHATMTSNFGYR